MKALDDFYCEDLAECYGATSNMTDAQKNEKLNAYPNIKDLFVALICMEEQSIANGGVSWDDWECDTGDIITSEVREKLTKS